jgi:hypothetical protein
VGLAGKPANKENTMKANRYIGSLGGGLLIGSLVALSTSACGSPPEPVKSTSAELVVGLADIAKYISTIYSAFNTGKSVLALIEGTTGPSLQDVESAIIAQISQDRADDLNGEIYGLLQIMNELVSNPSSPEYTARLADFLDRSDIVEGKIITTLNRGNIDDAHQLAAALNFLIPVHAAGMRDAQIPVSEINQVFAKVLQVDFQLIGAWSTSRSNPLAGSPTERNNSVLWAADAGNETYICPARFQTAYGGPGGYVNPQCLSNTAPGSPGCPPETAACDPVFNGGYCGLLSQDGSGYGDRTKPPQNIYDCLPYAYRSANQAFNRLPLTHLIETSMAHIIGMGVSTVTASDGTVITVVDPIGRADDIALTGGAQWASVPIAFTNGDGSFTVANTLLNVFPGQAQAPGAVPVVGDFGGTSNIYAPDGIADIFLIGGAGWTRPAVAVSNSHGGFTPLVPPVSDVSFMGWSTVAGAVPVAGDFDGNGRADLALVGGTGWASVPVAFSTPFGGVSTNTGTLQVVNAFITDFATWAQVAGAKPVAGDFDGDGRTDIALVGGAAWASVPVAFSNGDGTFRVANSLLADFPTWAQVAGATPVAGDFNGDGRADIALVGGSAWASVPVAFSNGDGSFQVANFLLGDFPAWAQVAGAKPIAGDFNGDGYTDVALTGGVAWASVPVAFSNGNGSFQVANYLLGDFPTWAQVAGAKPVAGVLR